jgi:hypothetical protein
VDGAPLRRPDGIAGHSEQFGRVRLVVDVAAALADPGLPTKAVLLEP